MDDAEKAALLKILGGVRKLNDLQRENKQSVTQMRDAIITHYQNIFQSVTSRNTASNKILVREIRVELLRLSILANPATQKLYRAPWETANTRYTEKCTRSVRIHRTTKMARTNQKADPG
ncbi:hypothetical protein CEB3_c01460 [Peptococcaceae bacterium CEB3]|nr:hypothetical protein CEB3_c01460 [Peptococcaceae bacterium CEB3]